MAAQLVIFDCDGVLVDTEPIAAAITSRLLTSMGWALTPAQAMDRFLGCTEDYFRAEVEAHLGRWSSADWDARFAALQSAEFAARLQPVDGIVPVLDELEQRGADTCVASNGSHAKMEQTLSLVGLHARFEGRIFSAQDVSHGKPAPDLYLHAAARMSVPPGHCVVVEDSPRGVMAARAAGMTCLGFAGRTPADRLAGDGVLVCRTMSEVAGRLRDLL